MSAHPPVVMIHGMWSRPWVWDHFRQIYEESGYQVYTPTLRHHDVSPTDPVPAALGNTSLNDYVSDLSEFIETLDTKPILVGHSMGGIIAQMLGAHGLARAVVGVNPACPSGVLAIRPSVARTTLRVLLRWGFWKKSQRLNRREAAYGLFNCMPHAQRNQLADQLISESGRAVFEIAFSMLDRRDTTTIDFANYPCPFLILAGADDNIVPASVCRATARKYGDKADYREYAGHAHWLLGEKGWQKIAQDSLDWLAAQA